MKEVHKELHRMEAERLRLLESYTRKTNVLQDELSATRAVIALLKQSVTSETFLPHLSLRRLFRPTELRACCLQAIREAGRPLDTRELAEHAVRDKGLDPRDRAIRKKVVYSVQSVMKTAVAAGLAKRAGRQKGVCLWALAAHK